jgi:hypothetical protein
LIEVAGRSSGRPPGDFDQLFKIKDAGRGKHQSRKPDETPSAGKPLR